MAHRPSAKYAAARTMLPQVACWLLLTALCAGTCWAQGGSWPQWRGPQREGISDDKGLARSWPAEGPPVVWQVDSVGVGYSSLSIQDGRIFTQGDLNGVEHVICLNEKDGRLLWAVQAEPVSAALQRRIAEELQRLDANQDGVVDEFEALSRLGWNFNKYDLAAQLTPEQIAARAQRLLARLDANQDGKLDFAEAGQLLREHFGRADADDRDADVDQLAATRSAAFIAELDKDGDGRISREEARRSALDQAFGRADKKEPGTDKADEQLTSEELVEYLRRFEGGRDGLITAEELAAYYTKSDARGDGLLTAVELQGYYGGYRNGMGDGPRGTPTVDGQRLYVEGGQGDLSCLDVATGRTIWHVNLRERFGGGVPGWGYSESPLIEGDLVIVTPGGKQGTVAALNKADGTLVWQSADIQQGAHYASPVVANIGGVRQVVQFARSSVFGLELTTGRLLWEYARPANGTANCATPIVHQDHVFASSAYGTGGGLARVSTQDGQQQAEEVYFDPRMANHHGGIVRVGDYMYGFGNGGLICMNFLTGEVAWRERSVNKGSLCVADGMLYLLGENHEVALAEATPEAYREHGRFKIPDRGRPSWAHPIVAGGRFYIRDQGTLTAYDVR